MNAKRITTALIGFPLVVIILTFGNKYIVDICFSIIAMLSLQEFYNAFKEKAKPIRWIGYLFAIAIASIHIIPIDVTKQYLQLLMPTIVAMLFLISIITEMKININDVAVTLLGICYVLGFIVFLPMIKGLENGTLLVWYVLFIAWGTDVFAYFIGKKWGKHKFSSISPNKSIEGCIAGVFGSLIASVLYTMVLNNYLGQNISYIYISFIAIALSILSQVGDFAASSIKRYTGIKDFSNLIPGHGGMLDRIDSVIFIAPFAYFLLLML